MHPPDDGAATEARDDARGVSRRTFLVGSASAMAVGLAACNGNGATTTTTAPPPTTEAPPGSTTTTSTTEAPPATTTTTTTMPPPAPAPGIDVKTVGETWGQPWVWRPTGEADDVLNLYVVENLSQIALAGDNLQNGALEQGPPLLFSWNGLTPGPTIRMGGAETLNLKLYNQLGQDFGSTPVGPSPDPKRGVGPYPGLEGAQIQKDFNNGFNVYGTGDCKIPADVREDWCLGEHVNGIHTIHVTNIHTHGLHVRPSRNPNGTHSDNIFVRVIPRGDAARGIERYGSVEAYIDACFPTDDVEVGEANYEFVLGRTERVPVHPPGTHWYHPHSHGSTHMQVAGGMAGFFIVEGDVDDLVNEQLTGERNPDPDVPTGPWDYRERTVLMQVINMASKDKDAPPGATLAPGARVRERFSRFPVVNGTFQPRIIVMRPGAIERWRLLNGSVDGNGYLRAALLEGEYQLDDNNQLADLAGNPLVVDDWLPVTTQENKGKLDEDLKAPLWQLAWDGITLVNEAGEYFVKDLNFGPDVNLDGTTIDVCYDSAENAQACYDRPNELRMTTGNRADVFWQAPKQLDNPDGDVYTLVGMPTRLHGGGPPNAFVAAYVVVKGDPVAGPADAPMDELELPEVPDYLLPIVADDPEMQVDGRFRTRTLRYSGWGSDDYPAIEVPPGFMAERPELNKLTYYTPPTQVACDDQTQTNPRQWWPVGPPGATDIPAGETSDLPSLVTGPLIRTMSIDGHKFDPTAITTPRMELNTVEEWAVFNQSIALWGPKAPGPDADLTAMKEAGTLPREFIWYVDDEEPDTPRLWFQKHQVAYPLTTDEAQQQDDFVPVVSVVDHPFHIHQNPFWLLTLDVVLNDGSLANVLPHPRWGDTQWIPRNGGRFIFRSRFYDYTGELVNHCHILAHEDNGMMQRIQIGPPWENPPASPEQPPQEPNYVLADAVFDGSNADDLYPPPTPDDSWERSAQFVDTGKELQDPPGNTGQVFPGFPVTAPELGS